MKICGLGRRPLTRTGPGAQIPPVRMSRSTIVTSLLAAVLALTALLAWQALSAARQRQAVARAALRDYAAFGATEFGRRSRDALTNASLFGLLRPALAVNGAQPPGRLPGPEILMQPPARNPDPDLRPAVRSWFRIVAAGATLRAAGDSLDQRVRDWLNDAVPEAARSLQRDNRYFGIVTGTPAGEAVAAGFVSRYGEDTRVAVTYGFVLPAAALAPVFASVVNGPLLLPRATAPVPNDSALVIQVLARGDAVVFRTGNLPYEAVEESLGTQFGGLTARVATRPEAAARFVIGGLPRLPILSLAGAFLLSVALVVVALLQLRRESELARLREDFVAGVSHELRTPLAQIRLFAETLLLGRSRSDDERRRALEIVHSESQRLSHLVDNLLQFSRASRPAGTLAIEPVALAPLVRDVVEGFAPLAAMRRVTLVHDADGGVVRADRDALRQVLLNLLDNTLKYGPEGQTVTVRAARASGRMRLAVEDQGPGLREQDRQRVFERFVRLDGARGTTGAGLGLSVVRELATRMEGSAWVEEAPGGGARFVVELPAEAG